MGLLSCLLNVCHVKTQIQAGWSHPVVIGSVKPAWKKFLGFPEWKWQRCFFFNYQNCIFMDFFFFSFLYIAERLCAPSNGILWEMSFCLPLLSLPTALVKVTLLKKFSNSLLFQTRIVLCSDVILHLVLIYYVSLWNT